MTRLQNDHPVCLARANATNGPMTVQTLAASTGLSVRVIHKVEAGHSVRETTLQAIADALDVNFGGLLRDVADWQRRSASAPTRVAA